MAQYIDKAVVMEEIEVRLDVLTNLKNIASIYKDEKVLFTVKNKQSNMNL